MHRGTHTHTHTHTHTFGTESSGAHLISSVSTVGSRRVCGLSCFYFHFWGLIGSPWSQQPGFWPALKCKTFKSNVLLVPEQSDSC